MRYKTKLGKLIALFLTFTMTGTCLPSHAASNEVPEAVYSGIGNAAVILNNMDYSDVKNSNAWSKEAIYETSAMDIMKGYGDKRFGRTNPVSKEQAIAIAYRIAGKEADAQKAGEALDNARKLEEKKKNSLSIWSDGYLQLAGNEGLISQQDLTDAFAVDTEEADDEEEAQPKFERAAPATRQEMAFWLAKAFNLPPVYGQQEIFNSYKDWKDADPLKVPYIEAVLQNNIMNGDGTGSFRPNQPVTREQAAQIVKNAGSIVLPLRNYEKQLGTIEDVVFSRDLSQGKNVTKKTFQVRNSNGKLHQILTVSMDDPSVPYKNEQSGKKESVPGMELVVYKNGKVGKNSLLSKGDRIEYIAGPDKTVKFTKVLSSVNDTKYIAAQIDGIDTGNLLLDAYHIFKMDYPDMGTNPSFNMSGDKINTTYRYSNDVDVMVDGKKSDIGSIKPNSDAILTIRDDIVVGIKIIDLSVKPSESKGETNVVKGIVEDNNPKLGYITLYNENGTGIGSGNMKPVVNLRNYNYVNPSNMEAFRNHKSVKPDDVKVGDTVFLKLDDKGNVISLSAVENYLVKYGRVISKKPKSLVIEYTNGTQQVLDIEEGISVIMDKKVTDYASLKDGDRVRLMLWSTNKFVKVKEIAIEGDEHFITNIYKGLISYIDDTSGKIVALNLEVLDRGKWRKVDKKGISDIKLSPQAVAFSGNMKLDMETAKNQYKNHTAYIAVENDYGGSESAVFISFRNPDDTEVVYDDTVSNAPLGTDEVSISKEANVFKYGPGTIIVKEGRLVLGNSLAKEDLAYVVANRDYNNGSYKAGIIQINKGLETNTLQIYRARIKEINEGRDFSVDSFSELNGMSWEFKNSPKTFLITNETRIMDSGGIVNPRDFKGYGTESFVDRVVYIVAKDLNTLLISTAPYGVYQARGDVYEVTGGSVGEDGVRLTEPTGLKVWKVKSYDSAAHLWGGGKDLTLNILKESILIKNNKIIKPSELRKGDQIRVIKKDGSETGDAYIVFVEG